MQIFRRGKLVIVVDDEDRENEGDFICAAEKVTPEIINFMSIHGRGLICTPVTETRAKQLSLEPMVKTNTSLHTTAFTVSIDYLHKGCTTGISAYDRATGIQALVNPATKPSDYARPGHIFPLIAKDGGVLRRSGHTEAAIDLARLAGFYPAGVLVEILNEDGTMARLPELIKLSKKLDLKVVSIKDLIAYRMQNERLVKQLEQFDFQSKYGHLCMYTFRQINTSDVHFAIVKGELNAETPTAVRVHSSHETGDLLGLLFNDRVRELEKAMQIISENGGVFLYIRNKIDRYQNMESMLQRVMGKLKKEEQRNFGIGAQILHELGIGKMKLITERPMKRVGLMGYGLEIVEHIALHD